MPFDVKLECCQSLFLRANYPASVGRIRPLTLLALESLSVAPYHKASLLMNCDLLAIRAFSLNFSSHQAERHGLRSGSLVSFGFDPVPDSGLRNREPTSNVMSPMSLAIESESCRSFFLRVNYFARVEHIRPVTLRTHESWFAVALHNASLSINCDLSRCRNEPRSEQEALESLTRATDTAPYGDHQLPGGVDEND